MKLSERILKKIEDEGSKYRFVVLYENNTYVTGFNEPTVIDTVKKFNSCYNSYISMIWDKQEGILYYSKTNKVPDARGRRNQSYFAAKTNEFIYNEDEETAPIVKLIPTAIAEEHCHGYIDLFGNFYKCGYECHRALAKELFISKTVALTEKVDPEDILRENYDKILDEYGWVKISSERIVHRLSFSSTAFTNSITTPQKKAIDKFLLTHKREEFEFQHMKMPKAEIIKLLFNDGTL